MGRAYLYRHSSTKRVNVNICRRVRSSDRNLCVDTMVIEFKKKKKKEKTEKEKEKKKRKKNSFSFNFNDFTAYTMY